MDIRNVGNNGAVERGDSRAQRPQPKRDGAAVSPVRDEAQISAGSRATADAVEGFAERARRDDADRADVVTKALQRLMNGELDGEAVHRATAARLLDAKFLSA